MCVWYQEWFKQFFVQVLKPFLGVFLSRTQPHQERMSTGKAILSQKKKTNTG